MEKFVSFESEIEIDSISKIDFITCDRYADLVLSLYKKIYINFIIRQMPIYTIIS